MRLSLKGVDLTNKKAARWCWFVFFVIGQMYFQCPASAQELSKPVDLAGQKLIVVLESMDAGCKAAAAIGVNKIFCFRASVKGGNEAWLKELRVSKFDALMPGHHHGMITRPKLTAIKPGEYLIEGVKLHMRGEWSLELKLQHGRETAQVAIPLKL